MPVGSGTIEQVLYPMDESTAKKRTYGYVQPGSRTQNPGDDRSKNKKKARASRAPGRSIFFYITIPFRILFWILKKITKPFRGFTAPSLRKQVITGVLTVGILVFVVGIFSIVWISKDLPNPDELTSREITQSTKLYDRTGQHLLYEILIDNSKKRTVVPYEKLPPNLVNGVVATEDKSFFEHRGVRPLSILRAALYGVLPGQRTTGASTLTQQLVKNVMLTSERSLTRKTKEIILSLLLEQKYSKEQILQIYFNEVSYGGTNYGVESASQQYFGKSVEEVNLQEAATLAGIPQQPSRFLRDHDALKQRRDFVLRRMYEEGYITEEEKNRAQAEPLTLKEHTNQGIAPHFVFYVIDQLEKQFGEEKVNRGGLRVITTLDWDKQIIANTAVKEESEKIFKQADANNAALVAINPRNGQVLAMVGSRDFNDQTIKGQFNVAVDGQGRQPGSSIKPIVYAAAFAKGYTPETVLFDVVTNFAASGDSYTPKNYNLKEYGLVTMRQALQGSLNIPAVKTLYLVGVNEAITFAKKFGYSTFNGGDYGLSFVLGGGEVHLLEHTSAYGVFANNGVRFAPHSILEVRDTYNNKIFSADLGDGDRVIEEHVAHTISNVLSDDAARSYIFGSGSQLTLKDRSVAAKTGTTNNYKDAWTMGYTPSLVTGVWVGNTDNTEMNHGFGGTSAAAPIWNRFMQEALQNTPVERFPTPPPNDAEKPVLRGGVGGITLKIDRVTNKRATSSTPESYIVDRTYIPPHDILHYVNKDDPRGPSPTDPTIDSQYSLWEAAVQDWIKRKKEAEPEWSVHFEDPPTEYDDAHSIELIPSLTILTPTASSTLTSRHIVADIQTSAPRGISRVTYKIDGTSIQINQESPFSLSYYARTLENGPHLLSIIAEDDIGNSAEQVVPFILNATEEPASVTWNRPQITIQPQEFPHTFTLTPYKISDILSLTISIYRDESSDPQTQEVITDFSNIFNSQLTYTIKDRLDPGRWILKASTKTKQGITTVDNLQLTIQ